MSVTVRYWAGAKRAAGHAEEVVEAASLDELKAILAARPEMVRVCSASSYLVDGRQAPPGTLLSEGSVVDVMPPFAGG